MPYQFGHWGTLTCRNCGKKGDPWLDGYKLFAPDLMFRGDDELIDELCIECYKNPEVKKKYR